MPAKTTIFNQRAVATHTFPLGPRNTIIFSPSGRFVLVAGFGNLAGQMDIYDLEKDYKKVCTIEGGNPSVCEWSPDSKYILTATTSPRLRVDNGVRLWHVGGGIMYNQDMSELYNITWRPQKSESFPSGDPLHPVPTPHASALAFLGTVKTPSKPAGAYRPPGARGTLTPLHFKREDEGGAAHIVSNGTANVRSNGFGKQRREIPGAETVESLPPGAEPAAVPGATEGDENLSKAALKNKKKREAKKLKDAEAKAAGLVPGQDAPAAGSDNRSPERRDRREQRSNSRSQQDNVRTPSQQRYRSNTYNQSNQGRYGPNGQNGQQQNNNYNGNGYSANPPPPTAGNVSNLSLNLASSRVQDAPELSVTSPGGGSPNAKKLRGLQKKVRAIEDLEMRLAGGEKLEDTQMKKIGTKSAVQSELSTLEAEG